MKWFIGILCTMGVWAQTPSVLYYFDGSQNNGLYLSYSENDSKYTELSARFFSPRLGDWEIFRDPAVYLCPDSILRVVWTTGATGFGLAESNDYVHFSNSKFVKVNMGKINNSFKNIWAPEIFYRKDSSDYIIIFAATLNNASNLDTYGYNHRHYFVSTKNWTQFTEVKAIDNGDFSQIDGTLTFFNNKYYFVFKDEREGFKGLRVSSSNSPTGPFRDTTKILTPQHTEGPALIWAQDTLKIYYDFYNGNGISQAISSTDLLRWGAPVSVSNSKTKMRHGSLIRISKDRLNRVQSLLSPNLILTSRTVKLKYPSWREYLLDGRVTLPWLELGRRP